MVSLAATNGKPQSPYPPGVILGANGQPYEGRYHLSGEVTQTTRAEIFRQLKAKYDAAQTNTSNQEHWANADNLDPHTANSYDVRRKLRSRSRYEVIENNPFLKGTILTMAGDFVGSGPKLQIVDERIPKKVRRKIERVFLRWFKKAKIRRKLWRARVARIVDGESFKFAYTDNRLRHPVKLNYFMVEADQVSSEAVPDNKNQNEDTYEIDGIRLDKFDNPLEYHLLHVHPGSSIISRYFARANNRGKWVDAENVLHWFRQDRGWSRGIPEITPSLPLCALLRRYTLAVVMSAETAANITALLETTGPPIGTDQDSPFDIFPLEMGTLMTLPRNYKLSQLDAKQPQAVYDTFVNSLLREINRPLLVPFNLASGSSADSNMASAVVDQHIYKSGVETDRVDCEEMVLEDMVYQWWLEAVRIPGLFGREFEAVLATYPELLLEEPENMWLWPKVGLDHTDPLKVAKALETLHNKKFITDRDVQESNYGRDVDDWRKEVEEDEEFRKGLSPPPESKEDKEDDEDEDE